MLKNNLSKIMGEQRIKISELVRISEISRSTIDRIYYNETKTISLHTLDRLCWALKCTPSELFEYVEK